MTGWRHDSIGSEIDREKLLRFTFDGRELSGFHGDTIASALLASGTQIVGRSFKYHRPRGLWGKGGEEPNAIFDVRLGKTHRPNQRATTTLLKDGMEVRSVNAGPSAAKDRFAFMDRFHKFLPAGFYYKTFMALAWKWYEPSIRKMAGLGKIDPDYLPPADVEHVDLTADLLVIGGGPAGLAAAESAAQAGRKVWLVDDGPSLGGSLRWRGGTINDQPWQDYVSAVCKSIETAGGRVFLKTTVWGAFDHGLFAAWQRSEGKPDSHLRIRVEEVVLAAGAIERPLWFSNNDLPGVMSCEAAHYYLNCHGAVPGKRVLVATGNDLAYETARELSEAGCEVMLADFREEACAVDIAFEVVRSAKLTAAIGKHSVTGAKVNGTDMPFDAILCSGGYTPSVHLWCQSGGKLDWVEKHDVLVPRSGTANMTVVGAANGAFELGQALESGWRAFGKQVDSTKSRNDKPVTQKPLRPDPSLAGRQWIDLQNDVTLKDVGLAAREGFTSVEHLKRYTTLGMATDQGRTSNFAGLAAMSSVTGKTIAETGTTTYRPPFEPVLLGVIAGRRRGDLFNPPKRLVLETAHREAGAKFREYGGWLRPSVYGDEAEALQAQLEAKRARDTVGIYDASPLGKLEVIGPAAGELLDFSSYVRMSSLRPGRARYGFMLSEAGIVFDDGVVLRLDENRFIVSASSSHVDAVRFRLEDTRQDRLARKGVAIHDVTQGFVTFSIAGPLSDGVLRSAGIALPDLAHMDVCEIEHNGYLMRIARISFTGDKSYEVTVPAKYANELRNTLDTCVKEAGGGWIGLEALMILRAEKGYILVGKDTDGNTMPHDLGWSGPREKRNDEYLGKRSLFNEAAKSPDRRQLVGLEVTDGKEPFVTGSHVVPVDGHRRSLGFVTSSYFSPNLERPIALALIEEGLSRTGETVSCFNNGEVREAKIAPACAFDAKGERLNG